MSIVRVWRESKDLKEKAKAVHINWSIWDRGDEIWELKGDILRHFEVLERSCGSDNIITERLRLLRESAIPLEAIRHSIQGWQVEECAVKPSPQAKPVLPLTSSPLSTPTPSLPSDAPSAGLQPSGQLLGLAKKGVNSKSLLAVGTRPEVIVIEETEKEILRHMMEHPLEEKIHHETPLQQAQVTLEEDSSQHFYNHPTELWSSLSQWIPQHALFQPSLHHQASLELSDTPAQTYPYQIDSSKNSRTAQGQRQHVRQGQQSKLYRPKPSLREIEIPKRPLFV